MNLMKKSWYVFFVSCITMLGCKQKVTNTSDVLDWDRIESLKTVTEESI